MARRFGLLCALFVIAACGGGGGAPGIIGGGGKASAVEVRDSATQLEFVPTCISPGGNHVGGSDSNGRNAVWSNGSVSNIETPTGSLVGGRVYAISADGRTVAGFHIGAQKAFWSNGADPVYIETPAGFTFTAIRPDFMSSDGQTVAGHCTVPVGSDRFWTWKKGDAEITLLPDGFYLQGMASDGKELFGFRGSDAVVRNAGTERILKRPTGDDSCSVIGGSANGMYVGVSSRTGANGYSQAVYWDSNGDVHPLGFFPNAQKNSIATAISSDGRTILGTANADNGQQTAFIWQGQGIVDLRARVEGYENSHRIGVIGLDASGRKVLAAAFSSNSVHVPVLITLP